VTIYHLPSRVVTPDDLVKPVFPREDSACAADPGLMRLVSRHHPKLVRRFFGSLFHANSLFHLSGAPLRSTEFYDSLVDSYAQRSPPLPVSNNDRVAKWARGNTGGPTRTPTASTRSGTLKRRVTRRTIAPSVYDEEEEGYGSGEWDEMYELTKIRVKIHFDEDVRGMALDPELPFVEFRQRVAAKFELSPQAIMLKFRDEDGGKVSLQDSSDYDLAIETARESAKGRPEGKLEVWCERK
jgi:neutrophil cytosolic factor 2